MEQLTNKPRKERKTHTTVSPEISPLARSYVERSHTLFSSQENINELIEVIKSEIMINPENSKPLNQLLRLCLIGQVYPSRFAEQSGKLVYQKFNQNQKNESILYMSNFLLEYIKMHQK
jgi:hypothetical protein